MNMDEIRDAFSPWRAWSELLRCWRWPGPERPRPLSARVGCYLVAESMEVDLSGAPADPADRCVFYIGETHGRTVALSNRLHAFGRSAGLFDGGQVDGHYSAWWLPFLFPARRPLGAGRTDASGLFVSLLPASALGGQPGHPLAGVAPLLAESAALWSHVQARGSQPRLNKKGRRTDVDHEEIDSRAWEDLLAHGQDPSAAMAAARFLCHHAVVRRGGKPWSGLAKYRDDNWEGVEGTLGRKNAREAIYVGWHTDGPGGVSISLWRQVSKGSWKRVHPVQNAEVRRSKKETLRRLFDEVVEAG